MNALDIAIFNKLTGSTALTALTSGGTASPSVYQWRAPEGQDPPYIIYNKQASTPQHTLTGVAHENAIYQVKGVTLGPSAAAAGTIASTIDTVLVDQALTIAGYTHMYLRRVSDIDYPEAGPGGQRIHHRGALYRILADPS